MVEGEISNEHLAALEDAMKQKDNKITELGGYAASTIMGQAGQNENLIVWQLELDNILERIEHLLKGDVIKTDLDGNLTYEKPEDESLIILNDYGVQLIMNVISFYLNRNTILSTYIDARINNILYDLGNELADVIYINYEKMGMDCIEKKSRYEILILNILNTIESSYNRAIGGEERESLRTARIVTQSLTPTGSAFPMKKRFAGGFLNPKNWNL